MQEAEVSLRIALYYITNQLTREDVKVSIDGAHIKTKATVHFDIQHFFDSFHCHKVDEMTDKWQGIYEVEGYKPRIIVSSVPGIGDVNITTTDGKRVCIDARSNRATNDRMSDD